MHLHQKINVESFFEIFVLLSELQLFSILKMTELEYLQKVKHIGVKTYI